MDSVTLPLPRRRALLIGAGSAALLAACGGGGGGGEPGTPGAPGDPAIHAFSADRDRYFVGEQAQLRVAFSGGSARLEPGGPVADGALVTTAPLDGPQRLRLVVEAPGRPAAVRELVLDVRFRDRWRVLGHAALSTHASVATADGGVLVLGGSRGEGVLSRAVERLDPASGRLQRLGDMAAGRSGHSALRLADGRILVAGGLTAESVAPFAELVDERTGASTPAGTMVTPRNWHAATALADGRVLVVGGLGRDSAELWDPATRRWHLVAQRMAHDRQYPSATLLADGRVLVAGGRSESGAPYVFAELFDPRSETFTRLPGGTAWRRQLHSAHRAPDGSVLIFGGEAYDGGIEPLASVLRFDPASERFTEAPALARPRTLAASLMLPGGEVLFFGGQTTPGELASDSAAAWHPERQRVLARLPSARLWHTAHRLPDGRVLVLGGDDGRGNFSTEVLLYD